MFLRKLPKGHILESLNIIDRFSRGRALIAIHSAGPSNTGPHAFLTVGPLPRNFTSIPRSASSAAASFHLRFLSLFRVLTRLSRGTRAISSRTIPHGRVAVLFGRVPVTPTFPLAPVSPAPGISLTLPIVLFLICEHGFSDANIQESGA